MNGISATSTLPFTLGRHLEYSKSSERCSVERIWISWSVYSRSYCSTSLGGFCLSHCWKKPRLTVIPIIRWVNRKDADGNNVFEGGFLGLDNIGPFNRSEPLPTGGTLRQADGTAWMAFFCLNMCVWFRVLLFPQKLIDGQVEYRLGISQT